MNRVNFDKQTARAMNNCCRNFFDREGLQGEMNEPMQFCPCCGRQLNDKEFAYYNKKLLDVLPILPPCDMCGGKLVYIRGRNPGEEERLVCPTCSIERLE